MKIIVRAKPRSKYNAVKKISEAFYEVNVTEPPVNGRANAAIIKELSKYFNVSPSQVIITAGQWSKQKEIEIL